jgi:hypothetical protein
MHTHTHTQTLCLSVCLSQKACLWWLSGWGSCGGWFVDKVERLVAEAADLGSQLVVFPEAFVGGYPRGNSFGAVVGSRSAKGREDYRKYHASAIDVPGLSSCILLSCCCTLDSVVQCCNSSPNPKSWKLSLCKGNLIQTLQSVCKWVGGGGGGHVGFCTLVCLVFYYFVAI